MLSSKQSVNPLCGDNGAGLCLSKHIFVYVCIRKFPTTITVISKHVTLRGNVKHSNNFIHPTDKDPCCIDGHIRAMVWSVGVHSLCFILIFLRARVVFVCFIGIIILRCDDCFIVIPYVLPICLCNAHFMRCR